VEARPDALRRGSGSLALLPGLPLVLIVSGGHSRYSFSSDDEYRLLLNSAQNNREVPKCP
jgi:hypothetical protein